MRRSITAALVASCVSLAGSCVDITRDRFYTCESDEDCIAGYSCLNTNIGRICYELESTEGPPADAGAIPDARSGDAPAVPDEGRQPVDPGSIPPDTTCKPSCKGKPCGSDDGCGGGCPPCAGPASCQQVKTENLQAKSGKYTIYPGGTGEPLEVYCEMQGVKGWTRIAWLAGEVPICAYSTPLGGAADLLADVPPKTTILPMEVAGTLFEHGEILITFTGGDRYLFRSLHEEWSWEAVATGAINSSNSGDYDIEGSLNWSPFYLVGTAHKGSGKPNLLGGTHEPDDGGQLPGGMAHTPFLGLGAFNTGQFDQATCPLESYKGLLYKSWGTAGGICLR